MARTRQLGESAAEKALLPSLYGRETHQRAWLSLPAQSSRRLAEGILGLARASSGRKDEVPPHCMCILILGTPGGCPAREPGPHARSSSPRPG